MSDKPAPPARQPGVDAGAPIGDLRAYVAIVRRRKWSLMFVTFLTVAAAVFFSYRQTPMYRSTESVLVKPLSADQQFQGSQYNIGVSMTTEQALATSPDVATLAREYAAEHGVTSPDSGSVSTAVAEASTTPVVVVRS